MLRYSKMHHVADNDLEVELVEKGKEAFFDENKNCVICRCHGPQNVRVEGVLRQSHTILFQEIDGESKIAYLICFSCRSDGEHSVCFRHPKAKDDEN